MSAPKQLVIKLPKPCMSQVKIIKTLFPTFKQIYLFRDPIKSIQSLIKVTKARNPLTRISGYIEDFWSGAVPLSHTQAHGNFPAMIRTGKMCINRRCAFVILSTLSAAKDFVESNAPFDKVFTYEDLLEDDKSFQKLYEMLMKICPLPLKQKTPKLTYFSPKVTWTKYKEDSWKKLMT